MNYKNILRYDANRKCVLTNFGFFFKVFVILQYFDARETYRYIDT